MAYAQGMGRSSILLISFLLSVDYGIRICTYFQMATIVLNTSICRLAFNPEPRGFNPQVHWFSNELTWENVYKYSSTVIPAIMFLLSLPLALKTTVNTLKYYARTLFAVSCVVLVLVICIVFLVEKNDTS